MKNEPASAVSFVDAGEAAGSDVPWLDGAVADTMSGLIDAIAASDRMIASVSAWRAELIDQARQWSEATAGAGSSAQAGGWNAAIIAHRELVTELACALRLPERTAERLIADSHTIVQQLPATLQALRAGEVTYRHAQAIADHANSLPAEAHETFEAAVLPDARRLTVAKLDRKARAVRERMHPESIEERRTAGHEDRAVWVQPARDGMVWLNAYLPAEQAIGIDDRLSQLADGVKTADEERTLTQLRADIFCDVLVDGEIPADSDVTIGRGIRARVLVTVPVLTLLGHSDEPATLEGYGPIDTGTAKALAAHAPSFTRLLTHPETGAVLSVGRDRYAVPKDLRTWLRVRDETCRFPGCSKRAGRCDIDHTIDWQHDGATRHDNLAHLCPSHHHVKHQTRWTVRTLANGVLEWTSPGGRTYTTAPAVRLDVEADSPAA